MVADQIASVARLHSGSDFYALTTARHHDSPAHSSTGTQSGQKALLLTVSTGFHVLFTPLSGFFSPFPHGTGTLSVTHEYLALQGGPR